MRLILALICAVLLGRPAIAADLDLICKGWLSDLRQKGLITFGVEIIVSVSGREVTVEVDPKYDLGGTPLRSVVKLVVIKSNDTLIQFESVERRRHRHKERALIEGVIYKKTRTVSLFWPDPGGLSGLHGECTFEVGSRTVESAPGLEESA